MHINETLCAAYSFQFDRNAKEQKEEHERKLGREGEREEEKERQRERYSVREKGMIGTEE